MSAVSVVLLVSTASEASARVDERSDPVGPVPQHGSMPSGGPSDAPALAERAGIDVNDVVTTVRRRVSREYPVSEAVPTRAGGLQAAPDIEWNGSEFFVTWADTRETGDEETRDIYGTRVSSGGRVLDPGGIAISTSEDDDERYPGVSWNGRSFLVVWKSYGDAGPLSVKGARVGTAGRVLDPSPILIERDGDLGSVASGDGTSLVEYTRDGGVWAKRVTATGEVIDPTGIAIAPLSYGGSAAWNGRAFLVVGPGRGPHLTSLVATRITVAGRVLDPSGITIAGVPNRGASVASDGTAFMVTWLDANSVLHASRVSANGRVLDPGGVAIASGARSASASWNGRVFLVVWGPGFAARVTRTGRVLDPGGSPFDTDDEGLPYGPVVAAGNDGFLVVWDGRHTEEIHDPDIHGALLTPDGRLPNPRDLIVSSAAPMQADPALAWNGRDFLVVWTEQRQHREWDLYAARVSASGAIRDGTGIPIATGPGGPWYAAVAWSGRHFLVVWADGRPGGEGVYGARIDAGGRLLDPGGFAISTNDERGLTGTPGVASDGRDFLVVWDGDRPDEHVVSAATSRDAAGFTGSGPSPANRPEPTRANRRSRGTARRTWSCGQRSGNPTRSTSRVHESSRTGRVRDPADIDIGPGGRMPPTEPSVASIGTTFFVAWSENIWDTARVRGARVDMNGRVLDPAAIELDQGSGSANAPTVMSYGMTFLVVWTAGAETRGVQVTRAGRLPNTTRFRFPGPTYALPAIARGPSRTFAMTYNHFAPPPLAAPRVFLRILGPR